MGGKLFQNSPELACRPFDNAHEGFIWGQASGCLILESATSAKKSDMPIIRNGVSNMSRRKSIIKSK